MTGYTLTSVDALRQPSLPSCRCKRTLTVSRRGSPDEEHSSDDRHAACPDVAGCGLRNGLELDHFRSGKCDAQHLGSEVHEHCIAVLGADHGTEAVPIMADSIAHGVARHNSDGWRLVEGASWEGPRGAGAARSHASSVRPLGRCRCAIARSSAEGSAVAWAGILARVVHSVVRPVPGPGTERR